MRGRVPILGDLLNYNFNCFAFELNIGRPTQRASSFPKRDEVKVKVAFTMRAGKFPTRFFGAPHPQHAASIGIPNARTCRDVTTKIAVAN